MTSDRSFNMRTAVVLWLITAVYMAIIFYASSRNGLHLPRLPENFDKVVHVLVYLPLAFLFTVSLRKSGLRRYVFAVAVLLATFYGITDEIHQMFVPGREASLGDTAADFIGAFFGSMFASLIKT